MATIWETVPAREIREGDVLQWGADGRVRVTESTEHLDSPLGVTDRQGRPAWRVHVVGPSGQFERYSGLSSGQLYDRDDPVVRMLPERAARVSDDNFRTLGGR